MKKVEKQDDSAPRRKWFCQVDWDSVPHLTEEAKRDLLRSIPPYLRDARTKGIPMLGSGAIYPVSEDDILVTPFTIPSFWPQGYALDVGWNRTAAIWGARDNSTGVIYLTGEYYQGQQQPAIHAYAIKSRGDWIPGVIDPAARGRSQIDGRKLITEYRKLGLDLQPAINTVETGIAAVWQALSSGRLKVFRNCTSWLSEFRIYQRDKKGKVVKVNDHLMDCCLAGSTKVCTSMGNIPIEQLVGTSGYVISRAGAVAEFIEARKVFNNVPVVRLEFDNGDSVVCTPDHPFLTPSGWITAIAMQGHTCYNGVAQGVLWKNSELELSQKQYKNFKNYDTTSSVHIFLDGLKTVVQTCIALFGEPLTEVLVFPGDVLSTIRTGIRQIINPLTYNYCPQADTANYITEGIDIIQGSDFLTDIGQSKLYKLLLNGINQKQARSGIENIMQSKSAEGKYITLENSSALIALNTLQLKIQELIDFARTIVNLAGVERLALMMRNVLARFVAEVSWLIVTAKHELAQQSVLVNCSRVSNAGRQDVFCLEVPSLSAFCIESGLTVHNTRYFWMSGRERMIPMPIENENKYSQDFFGENNNSKWMQ